MSKADWFEKWMADGTGRTAEECGRPTKDTVREVSNVCPHCGALEKEFTLKHRLGYDHSGMWGVRSYNEVMLGGGLWKFVSVRAFHALENATINNLSELRDGINDGSLLRTRNCGRKTVRELTKLVWEYESEIAKG
mgnify:CR=1 FL=1|tara:strand:+ start:1020 stop:1427 length:408 start_codon:yes stop_codon:yes gene_type:complete